MGGVITALRQCLRLSSPPEFLPCGAVAMPPMPTMEITGEVKFRSGSEPDVLPANSHLTARFDDVSLMDGPSLKIAESIVDVTNIYKKGKPMMYSITCSKPWAGINDRYSVSAALNVGWKPDGDDSIREGDYFNDTTHPVQLEDMKDFYKVDIEVVKNQ